MAHPFKPYPADNTFDDLIVLHQKKSNELVVYSRLLGRVVTLSWPTHNGVKIVPRGIRLWLRTRCLFWECFCALRTESNQPRPCQIVESQVTKDVYAFCHFEHARCGFKMNLSQIHGSSRLVSSYGHLPTSNSAQTQPDMQNLRQNWQRLHGDTLLAELAPHFAGYCGENTSGYPAGTHQLSGPLLFRKPKEKVGRRRHSSPYIRHELQAPRSNAGYVEIDDLDFPARLAPVTGRSKPSASISAPVRGSVSNHSVAGPSRITLPALPSASAGNFLPSEQRDIRLLRDLAHGKGISEYSWEGLVDQCQVCGNYFAASVLKKHIPVCKDTTIVIE
ncbi:hypothetical protein R3P38DRAFT_2795448 [Favolaschia claudopus]|uniref:Uncharacterized protein n=1 Tax=Favolaschia claudopus TaxID=2862362 RepID=A0AAW0A7Z9_9AGAR